MAVVDATLSPSPTVGLSYLEFFASSGDRYYKNTPRLQYTQL